MGKPEPSGDQSYDLREPSPPWNVSSQEPVNQAEINKPRLRGWRLPEGLTFCFGTDEAGGGAVEEVQDPSYSHTDVGVAGVEVQSCKSLGLELDKLLWGHFELGDLGGGAKMSSREDPERERTKEKREVR